MTAPIAHEGRDHCGSYRETGSANAIAGSGAWLCKMSWGEASKRSARGRAGIAVP